MTPGPTEDVLALLALQAEYADGADSFDGAAYAAVFTEDAVLDATHTGMPAVAGRAAIAKLMDDTFAQQTHNCHMTTNQRVVSVDGDTATGRCYFFQRSILRNGGRTEFSGRYEDVYRRTDAGWKIQQRVLVELLPTVLDGYDVPDVSAGAAPAPTPASTVRDFFAGWGDDLDTLMAAMSRHLAPDVVWEQTGLPTANSLDEALALMESAGRRGTAAMSAELVALAADGNTVLTERIDRILAADGSVTAVIPVMGILELGEDLLVRRWREYFDVSILAALRSPG